MFILHCLIVLFVSMVPLVELRGAIPIGVGLGLPEVLVFILAIIGNMLPVPLIYLFGRKFLEWGVRVKWKPLHKFCSWCLRKGEKAGKKLLSKAGVGLYVALFLFVGIPLPGTGAWTGTLAASMLDLDFKKTTTSVMVGVLTAGIIMMVLSLGVFKGVFGG